MAFDLPPLPYDMNALEPYISAQTMGFHYGKHHKTYVDNLNKLIAGTHFENMSLEEIIRQTAGKTEYTAIFNNAATVRNICNFHNGPLEKVSHAVDERIVIDDIGNLRRGY